MLAACRYEQFANAAFYHDAVRHYESREPECRESSKWLACSSILQQRNDGAGPVVFIAAADVNRLGSTFSGKCKRASSSAADA